MWICVPAQCIGTDKSRCNTADATKCKTTAATQRMPHRQCHTTRRDAAHNGGSTADIWSNAHAHVEQVVYRSHFSPGFLLIVVKGLRRHVLGCSTLMSAMGYLLQHVVTKDVTSNVRLSNLCITNNLSHNLWYMNQYIWINTSESIHVH